MAEFFVRIKSAECLFDAWQSQLAYKAGDIFQCYPDGTVTDIISQDNPHCLIRVPSLTYEEGQKYAKPKESSHKREYQIDFDDLNPNKRIRLLKSKEKTITLSKREFLQVLIKKG